MENKDKDDIIEKMMRGSELVRKSRNKGLKVFRRKNKNGKASRSSKKNMGRHLNLSPQNEIGEE